MTIASPKGVNIVYVPVTNAATIAAIATKVKERAKTNKKTYFWNNLTDRMKWTKTVESETAMAMASDTKNDWKAAFLVRIAVPPSKVNAAA